MGTMTSKDFEKLLDITTVIDKVIYQKFPEYKGAHERYMNMGSTTKAAVASLEVAALGSAPENPLGENIYIDEFIQGPSKSYPVLDYGLGFRTHENLVADDQMGIVRRFASALPRSFNSTIAQTATNVLNYGFTVANGIDGKYLFATDHPLIGGGTYSNYSTASLSTTSLWAAINSMRQTPDDRGHLLDIEPAMLIVPPYQEKKARQLFETKRGEPGTANNDSNTLEGFLELVVDKRLTDNNAWFVLARKGEHSINFDYRKTFWTGIHPEPLARSVVNYGLVRFVVYHDGWRGSYGSIGTV